MTLLVDFNVDRLSAGGVMGALCVSQGSSDCLQVTLGGVEGMERDEPCVRNPATPGPPGNNPRGAGDDSMKRSCFWSRY